MSSPCSDLKNEERKKNKKLDLSVAVEGPIKKVPAAVPVADLKSNDEE